MKVTNLNGIMTPGIHTIRQADLPENIVITSNKEKLIGIFARMDFFQCPVCGKDGAIITVKLDGDRSFARKVCMTDVDHNTEWTECLEG